MVSERLRENLIFLSSLGRYNTERRPVIRQYFDQQLRTEELGQKEVDASDVREFGDQKKLLSEESDTDFNEIFQEILLTLPEDINPQDFQGIYFSDTTI
jgi:hypothetical protein